MEKIYVSVDVETSGPTPGKYSMISLGACIVGKTHKRFYRELKPISNDYIADAMRIGCLGLECLERLKKVDGFNPKSKDFRPDFVLTLLDARGEDPSAAMYQFNNWVLHNTAGRKPVIAAAPIIFDGSFVSYYFDNFCNAANPFGHSGEDINSMYRGAVNDITANIRELGLRPKELPHNALEDSIIQAVEFGTVLQIMNHES